MTVCVNVSVSFVVGAGCRPLIGQIKCTHQLHPSPLFHHIILPFLQGQLRWT
jgi:hypothetical protein